MKKITYGIVMNWFQGGWLLDAGLGLVMIMGKKAVWAKEYCGLWTAYISYRQRDIILQTNTWQQPSPTHIDVEYIYKITKFAQKKLYIEQIKKNKVNSLIVFINKIVHNNLRLSQQKKITQANYNKWAVDCRCSLLAAPVYCHIN